jgi:dTDP-4-amino-4,6-dideoxygalactose transaminase
VILETVGFRAMTARLEFQPPAIGDEEAEAAAAVVRSGWLGNGPRTALLEERMSEALGAEHVVGLASCTAAMHLTLRALDVGPGDEVVTSPITWPATANVVELCGARPVFCDVRSDDLTLDPSLVENVVTERTKAILPVHFAGQPTDLDPLLELGVPVVEDAAHALGAAYRGRPIGALGRAACFSLYVTKPVAAGEGGLLATDDGDLAARVRRLAALRRDSRGLYDQVEPSYKASLADVFAAVALVQLGKLELHADARARQFAVYDEGLADLDGIVPLERDARDRHAYHLYVVRIRREQAGGTRDEYAQALRDHGIGSSVHFLPVHRLTWFRERYPDQPRLPIAEQAGDEVLSLPLSARHTDADIARAVAVLRATHARLTS